MRATSRVLALAAVNAAACGILAACNALTGVANYEIVSCFGVCADAAGDATSSLDGASEAAPGGRAGDSSSASDASDSSSVEAGEASVVDASEASVVDASDGAPSADASDGSVDASDASDSGPVEAAAPDAGPDAGGPCVGPPDGGVVVVSLGLGSLHTCVALSDGTVHCWGDNTYGELGTGDNISYWTATTVVGVERATAVAAEESHTCAIVDAGVWCWGDNYYDELGFDAGTTTCSGAPCDPVPTAVPNLLALGHPASLALAQSTFAILGSTLYAWGETPFPSPVTGPALTAYTYTDGGFPFDTVDEIAVADDHACARSGGQIACWGESTWGQLGRGNTTDTSPGLVNISNAVHVCTGDAFSCFVNDAGEVWCFGADTDGQLGTLDVLDVCNGVDTDPCSLDPTQVSLPFSASNVACGDSFACALSADGGNVDCWGYDGEGEMGIGGNGGASLAPAEIPSFACVTQFAAHGSHACAVRTDGSLWCWGLNSFGQIGDGTENSAFSPESIKY